MDKLLFKRILITALTLLAVIYAAYLLISANFEMYPTENAVEATVNERIFTNAFIIRDETVIENKSSGVLSYSCGNGAEVSVGGEIAKVYSNNADALAQTNADALEEKLNSLETIQKNHSANAISIDTINNSIYNNLTSYLSNVSNGDMSAVSSDYYNLIDSINQRQLYTGKDNNFNKEIDEIKKQIDALRASSGESIGTIKTDKAGCFAEYCDGYENALKYADIDKMELEDLKNIKPSKVSEKAAGKIIGGLSWYVACEVSADEATALSIWDENVSVLFSDASTKSIPASIYKIQQKNKTSPALVILKCDYMDKGLIEARQEPIEIGMGTYKGLRVSKRAIHDDYVTKTSYDENDKPYQEKAKVQGVYVIHGNEIRFKQISIIYADDDYVICDTAPSQGVLFNGKTVELYDKVIIKGDDLYDGKVIQGR